MAQGNIPLARDGYPLIGGCIAAAVAAGLLACVTGGWLSSVFQVLTLVAVVGTAFFLNFFRDPERHAPQGEGLVISPADGEIIIAEPDVDEPRFLKSRAAKISIFMSPMNVHVNRAPVDGEVTGVHYNAGKYFAAWAEKASLDNEQNAIVMRSDEGRSIVFVQIAGFLARRIVCRVGSLGGDRPHPHLGEGHAGRRLGQHGRALRRKLWHSRRRHLRLPGHLQRR